MFSVYGYGAIDAFIRGAQKAGTDLSTDSFIRAMDTMVVPRDMFGTAEASFSPTKRLGNNFSRLSQLQEGRWKVVSEYVAFNGLRPVLQKNGTWKIGADQFKD